MYSKNELIYTVREIFGDEEADGFYLTLPDGTKVPNYLFKDGEAKYPEIRISPFLSDKKFLMLENQFCSEYKAQTDMYQATFQVDVYSTNIPELNEICREIETRVRDFVNPETITYDWSPDFINQGDYYKNTIYNNKDFNVAVVAINGKRLLSIKNIENLSNNSWYLGDDALYIKTDQDITKIQVMVLYEGRFFANHDSLYNRGIERFRLTNMQNLSMLNDNEVERAIYEIDIVYGLDHIRKAGPLLDTAGIGANNGKKRR